MKSELVNNDRFPWNSVGDGKGNKIGNGKVQQFFPQSSHLSSSPVCCLVSVIGSSFLGIKCHYKNEWSVQWGDAHVCCPMTRQTLGGVGRLPGGSDVLAGIWGMRRRVNRWRDALPRIFQEEETGYVKSWREREHEHDKFSLIGVKCMCVWWRGV